MYFLTLGVVPQCEIMPGRERILSYMQTRNSDKLIDQWMSSEPAFPDTNLVGSG